MKITSLYLSNLTRKMLLYWMCCTDAVMANHSCADTQYHIMTLSVMILLYNSFINKKLISSKWYFAHTVVWPIVQFSYLC